MNPQIERRVFVIDGLEVRAGDADTPMIVGHAAVFDKLSEDMFGFREKIAPGAFANTLDADVRALFNHSPDVVLGRTTAGTLRLAEDKTGLAVEIDPPDTQAARDLMVSMERGDITQMSFGFRTVEDKFETKDDEVIRTLLEVELFDVSPVTFPAYPDTDVAVRAFEAWQESQVDGGGDDDENAVQADDLDDGDDQAPTLADRERWQRLAEIV